MHLNLQFIGFLMRLEIIKLVIFGSITLNESYKPCLEFKQLAMNYLAHLHIAEQSDSNLLGNLLGDFVKGDPSKRYGVDVVQGIRLHRCFLICRKSLQRV